MRPEGGLGGNAGTVPRVAGGCREELRCGGEVRLLFGETTTDRCSCVGAFRVISAASLTWMLGLSQTIDFD
jgi:hypothetical protein